jgi:hypothetical protein
MKMRGFSALFLTVGWWQDWGWFVEGPDAVRRGLWFEGLVCQSLHNGFGMAGNHGEIGAGGAVWAATALFPILQGARVKGKAAGKLSAAETGCGSDRADIDVELEGEMMRRCGLRFSLSDGGGFAHGLD